MIQFFVPGIPAPGGSKRAFGIKKAGVYTGRFVVTDDAGQRNKDWRANVAWTAKENMSKAGLKLLSGALILEVEFVMPRPKMHFKKSNGQLKEKAPYYHTNKPDATKLLRALEDALTKIAWDDDSQISVQRVRKIYGSPAGAHVTVDVIQAAR